MHAGLEAAKLGSCVFLHGFLFPLKNLKHGEEKCTEEKFWGSWWMLKNVVLLMDLFTSGASGLFNACTHKHTHTHGITWQACVFVAQHQEMGVPLPTEKIRAMRQRWGIRPSLSLSGALARTALTQIISRSSEPMLHCGHRRCCRKNRLRLLLFHGICSVKTIFVQDICGRKILTPHKLS